MKRFMCRRSLYPVCLTSPSPKAWTHTVHREAFVFVCVPISLNKCLLTVTYVYSFQLTRSLRTPTRGVELPRCLYLRWRIPFFFFSLYVFYTTHYVLCQLVLPECCNLNLTFIYCLDIRSQAHVWGPAFLFHQRRRLSRPSSSHLSFIKDSSSCFD